MLRLPFARFHLHNFLWISVMSFNEILNSGRIKGAMEWINYMKQCDLRMTPGKSYAVLIPMMRAFTCEFAIFQVV